MSVEYGFLPVLIIVTGLFYLILKNFKKENELEIVIFLMFLTQNSTNDLIYAPDVQYILVNSNLPNEEYFLKISYLINRLKLQK